MEKIFTVIADYNNLRVKLPHAFKNQTMSVALKEVHFYDFIENVKKDIIIQFFNSKNEKVFTAKIPKGYYELYKILEMINAKVYGDVHFYYNTSTFKMCVNNGSNYLMSLNPYAIEFFNLPAKIYPNKIIQAEEPFKLIKTQMFFVTIKNLESGEYLESYYNNIIFSSILSHDKNVSKVYSVDKLTFYDLPKNSYPFIDISIIDEFGTKINVQNIRMKLIFRF